MLDNWYRKELKAAVPALLQKWRRIVGAEASNVVVRRMRAKWGTCQAGSPAIWLNPELAKKNSCCLEHIMVHEISHLIERTHNERFIELMNLHMSDWRVRRDELNDALLTAEDWAIETIA